MLALVMGCNPSSKQSSVTVNPDNATRYYDESQLGNMIVSGMTVADVTNKFGLPGSLVKVSKERTILIYAFRFGVLHDDNLTGFTVDTTDDHVVRWAPIKGPNHSTSSAFNGEGPLKPFGEQSFRLFLANGSMTNVANLVDSKGSADASDLEASPEMTFNAKVFVGSINGELPDKKAVLLVVSEKDASKLKGLTENNLGRRLLIVIRNRVIAAPVISVPLASTQIEFTVKDSSVFSAPP